MREEGSGTVWNRVKDRAGHIRALRGSAHQPELSGKLILLLSRGLHSTLVRLGNQGLNLMNLYCLPPVQISITDSTSSLTFNF